MSEAVYLSLLAQNTILLTLTAVLAGGALVVSVYALRANRTSYRDQRRAHELINRYQENAQQKLDEILRRR